MRVITAEIHRLAHFGYRVIQRFARFTHRQHHQSRCMGFQGIGKTAQHRCALGRAGRRPSAFSGFGGSDHFRHRFRLNKSHAADGILMIGRIVYCAGFLMLHIHGG